MIILALYVDIVGLSNSAAREQLESVSAHVNRIFESAPEVIKTVVIPGIETKLECVYPNNFAPEDSARILELFESIEKKIYGK